MCGGSGFGILEEFLINMFRANVVVKVVRFYQQYAIHITYLASPFGFLQDPSKIREKNCFSTKNSALNVV